MKCLPVHAGPKLDALEKWLYLIFIPKYMYNDSPNIDNEWPLSLRVHRRHIIFGFNWKQLAFFAVHILQSLNWKLTLQVLIFSARTLGRDLNLNRLFHNKKNDPSRCQDFKVARLNKLTALPP